jgi:hypothetical protein
VVSSTWRFRRHYWCERCRPLAQHVGRWRTADRLLSPLGGGVVDLLHHQTGWGPVPVGAGVPLLRACSLLEGDCPGNVGIVWGVTVLEIRTAERGVFCPNIQDGGRKLSTSQHPSEPKNSATATSSNSTHLHTQDPSPPSHIQFPTIQPTLTPKITPTLSHPVDTNTKAKSTALTRLQPGGCRGYRAGAGRR